MAQKTRRGAAAWRARPLLVVLLYYSMFSIGLLNGVRSVCAPLVKAEFGVGYGSQGLMLAFSNLACMAAALVSGTVLEKAGAKRAIIAYCVMLAASLCGMAWAPAFFWYACFFCVSVASSVYYETCKNDVNLRCFPRNFAAHVSLVSFFVGVGGIVGPKLASWLIAGLGFTSRGVFLLAAVVPMLLLALALPANFNLPLPEKPREAADAPAERRITTLQALRLPVTWICGLGFAFGSNVGKGMEEWALLYFQDMFGTDPLGAGANFLSLFFIFMSAGRLVNGFAMERAGYFRYYTLLIGVAAGLMAGGLLLGEGGMWMLALCGGVAMTFWPMHGAIMLKSFGKSSPSVVAAAYAISSGVRAVTQWLTGMLNTWIGPGWGFRSLLVYLVLLLGMVLAMKRALRPYKAWAW